MSPNTLGINNFTINQFNRCQIVSMQRRIFAKKCKTTMQRFKTVDVLVNNTNLTFLTFLYNNSIKGFQKLSTKKSKQKQSDLQWKLNSQSTITGFLLKFL